MKTAQLSLLDAVPQPKEVRHEEIASTVKREPKQSMRSVEVSHEACVKRLVALIEKNAHMHRPWQVFDDWLEMVDGMLTMLPLHALSVLEHAKTAEDTPKVAATWSRLRERYERPDFERFAEMWALLLESTGPADAPSYQDALGSVYMLADLSNRHNGQYFTPWPVARMMAEMQTDGGEEIRRRRAAGNLEPIRVHDPCCGSGAMLLAYASTYPREMVLRGEVQFYGQDNDATCVRMCQCNVRLYGLNRSGLWLPGGK